uniref:Uncharacterized protein n=1 Tax=Arundo donax TaxID=35708 RepID=A0A0A8ZQH0_ARUDO
MVSCMFLLKLFPQVSLTSARSRRGSIIQGLFLLVALGLKHLRRIGVTGLFRCALAVAEQLRRDELV